MAVTNPTTVPAHARPATGTPERAPENAAAFEAPLYAHVPRRGPTGPSTMDTRDLILEDDAVARTMGADQE